MVFLKKVRFPVSTYDKLKNKKIRPCKILNKISANAYIIYLHAGLHISPSFNVADLTTYKPPDEFQIAMILRSSPHLRGKNDVIRGV